jgi:hypothetical protein
MAFGSVAGRLRPTFKAKDPKVREKHKSPAFSRPVNGRWNDRVVDLSRQPGIGGKRHISPVSSWEVALPCIANMGHGSKSLKNRNNGELSENW